RNAAERRRASHDFGRAPLSEACRILLSRGSVPHHRSRAGAAAAGCRAWRSAGKPRGLSADHCRARACRHRLEGLVLTFRAVRRPQDDEDASRPVVRAGEIAMNKIFVGLALIFVTLALAGCGNGTDRILQGWVEAELLFVPPDEQGRVETLKVR